MGEEHTMEYIEETVKSAKQTREIGLALEGVTEKLLQGAADGDLTVSEVLESLTSNVEKFLEAGKDIDKIDDEHEKDLNACINAWDMMLVRVKGSVFRYAKARKAAKEAAAEEPVSG